MEIGIGVLRLVVGLLFIGHGMQKLAGWFGGGGIKGTAQAFEAMGLKPGRANAIAAGLSETVGGALFVVGLATPLAAAMISGTMFSAIRQVHAPKGVWAHQGGWEYNAVLIASAYAIAADGAGELSLDHVLDIDHSGPLAATAALLVGALGSLAVTARAKAARDDTGGAQAAGNS
jgi:putative oxidoreductase